VKIHRGARWWCVVILSVFACLSPSRAGDKIDPSYLALKDCPAQPGCPAIVLLNDHELNNDSNRSRYTVHRIVKVFTDEGVQHYSDVEAPSTIGGWDVRNLEGRTILPDGKEIKLTQDNIFVKTLRKGKRWERTKTAKFPGVQPGAIIEYSYDVLTEQLSLLTELTWFVQMRLPIVDSRFTLKPGKLNFVWMKGGSEQVPVEEKRPFKNVAYYTAHDVPGIPDEPFSPPEEALQARYLFNLPEEQAAWLGVLAARVAGATGEFVTDAPGVKAKVTELGADTAPALERVKKIYRFVQEKIDTEDRRAGATGEEALKEAKSAGEVLQRGFGSEWERALLFLAMVREAGLEYGFLMLAGRFSSAFNPSFPDESQFDSYAVAVKTGSGWTFYDPAARHCPFGMISGEKEGGTTPNGILLTPLKGAAKARRGRVQNLITTTYDPVPFAIATVPASSASKNVLKREAKVAYRPDGGLDVTVSDQGTGLVDLAHRQAYEKEDEAGRLKVLREKLSEIFPVVEVESAEFQDIESFDKPASLRYTLHLPGEPGQGDRLLVTPSLFHAGQAMPFTAEARRTEVRFQHARRQQERVEWNLPAGYEVEDLPGPVAVKDPPFTFTMNYSTNEGVLVMSRTLDIDTNTWPAKDYPRLKAFFEKVQEADGRVISLKKSTP
jgi:hypothetical protein